LVTARMLQMFLKPDSPLREVRLAQWDQPWA
jgi:hypothetical protein